MKRWYRPDETVVTSGAGPGSINGTAFLETTPRLLIFPLLIILQLAASALGGIGFVTGSPPSLALTGTLLWLAWFGGLFAMALRPSDNFLFRFSRRLRRIALVALGILLVTMLAEGVFMVASIAGVKYTGLLQQLDHTFLYNDATALCHQATDNLLKDENPYANGNVVNAILEFGGASDRITPRRVGMLASVFPYPTEAQLQAVWQKALASPDHITPEIETRMNYPAGAFELPAPFIWLGIGDIRWVYLIFTLPGMAAAVWLAPRKFRWPLAALMLVSLTFWNSLAAGETGILAFPFMLLGWVLARKLPWYSAIFMGLAMAVKQTAFFLVPFYLVLVLRTLGWKKTMGIMGIMAVVFGATNLPFIIRDPGLWINSMGAPMSEDFFPIGAGVITLVTTGLVDIQSSAIFTLAEGVVMGAGLAWYFANCRKYPHTGPVLAFLPLFFAWRSLWSYFFYIDIIVLSGIIIDEYGSRVGERRLTGTNRAGS